MLRLPIGVNPGVHHSEQTKQASAAAASPLRVLIVEDHEDIAVSFSLALAELGYSSIRASSGEQGLEIADQFAPDVVLVDIGLPGMSGFEFGKRLRQMPKLSGILVIALSGYSPASFREGGTQGVFDHYLIKPVDPGTILEIIAASLAQTGASP
jgi:CheY-like chemotaxis protein